MTLNKFNFRVAELNTFDVRAIPAIANEDLVAVRIPKWCSEEACVHFQKQVAGIAGTAYEDEPGFLKIIGGAVYDAANKPELLDQYLDDAASWSAEYRKVFWPYLSPIDKLFAALQQQWPHGCELQRFKGRPGFAGLVRAFEDGKEARAHQDMTHWDIPDVREAHDFDTQLSAVVYLGCAKKGGDLQLWDFGFRHKAEYEVRKIPNDYGIDRNLIGEPAISLTPRLGELIIFNARTLHAVSYVLSGRRSSQSTFIAYRGLDQALSVFS